MDYYWLSACARPKWVPDQRCADPEMLRPHQSADSDHRSASATVPAGRCCLGSATRFLILISDPCLHLTNRPEEWTFRLSACNTTSSPTVLASIIAVTMTDQSYYELLLLCLALPAQYALTVTWAVTMSVLWSAVHCSRPCSLSLQSARLQSLHPIVSHAR